MGVVAQMKCPRNQKLQDREEDKHEGQLGRKCWWKQRMTGIKKEWKIQGADGIVSNSRYQQGNSGKTIPPKFQLLPQMSSQTNSDLAKNHQEPQPLVTTIWHHGSVSSQLI